MFFKRVNGKFQVVHYYVGWMRMDKRALLFLPVRLAVALVLCAAIALGFMRFLGGAGMFCIDPPAADPGWEWKVPLAWIVIYGISSFSAIFAASIRPRQSSVPIIIASATIGVFVLLRMFSFRNHYSYWGQVEAHWGLPAMFLAGVIGCLLAIKTKRTEQ
ncbi:MAG: hypothetical protein ACYS29_02715 [Planctomycetota bacterium]|jgi:hypothetical protein